MGKTVRMADIASRLGVSVVSVSKALAGKEGVGEKVRAQIIETAKEMGYVPPARKKESESIQGTIGLIVADRFFYENTFYSNLYRMIVMRCTEQGYSVLLEIVEPEAEISCRIPKFVTGERVDGLIFMGEINHNYLYTVLDYEVPYILLDFYVNGWEGDSVLSNNLEGGWILTQHLIQTGRRNIGFVGSVTATTSIMDRYLGYVKAQIEHGIVPRPEWRLEDRNEKGRLISVQLPKEMPQAFVCSCDEVAFNLMEQLKMMGYQIPKDVAITGYDDFLFATLTSPKLTTYEVDVKSMAHTVVAQLHRKIKHKSVLVRQHVIGGRLIRREST